MPQYVVVKPNRTSVIPPILAVGVTSLGALALYKNFKGSQDFARKYIEDFFYDITGFYGYVPEDKTSKLAKFTREYGKVLDHMFPIVFDKSYMDNILPIANKYKASKHNGRYINDNITERILVNLEAYAKEIINADEAINLLRILISALAGSDPEKQKVANEFNPFYFAGLIRREFVTLSQSNLSDKDKKYFSEAVYTKTVHASLNRIADCSRCVDLFYKVFDYSIGMIRQMFDTKKWAKGDDYYPIVEGLISVPATNIVNEFIDIKWKFPRLYIRLVELLNIINYPITSDGSRREFDILCYIDYLESAGNECIELIISSTPKKPDDEQYFAYDIKSMFLSDISVIRGIISNLPRRTMLNNINYGAYQSSAVQTNTDKSKVSDPSGIGFENMDIVS